MEHTPGLETSPPGNDTLDVAGGAGAERAPCATREHGRGQVRVLPSRSLLSASATRLWRVSSHLASSIQRAYSLRWVKESRSKAARASGSRARARMSASGSSTSRGASERGRPDRGPRDPARARCTRPSERLVSVRAARRAAERCAVVGRVVQHRHWSGSATATQTSGVLALPRGRQEPPRLDGPSSIIPPVPTRRSGRPYASAPAC
jgi:hypothetical protein